MSDTSSPAATSAATTSIGNEGLITGVTGPLGQEAQPQGSESPASEPPGAPGALLGPSGDPLARTSAIPGIDAPARSGGTRGSTDAERAHESERVPVSSAGGHGLRGKGDGRRRVDHQRGTAMAGWNASPWALVRAWSEQMDHMFEELMRLGPWRGASGMPAFWGALAVPAIRTRERDGRFEVVADLPGVEREALRVSLDANVLTIAGERHEEDEPAHSGSARGMQLQGRFERSVVLPGEVDPEGVEATLSNGVLRITLPVAGQAHGRRIEVRGE